MKKLLALVLLTVSCVTIPSDGDMTDLPGCPARLSDEEQRSGFVQCRAMCASYGRDIVEFNHECKCVCTQPLKPKSPLVKPATPGQSPNTQI